jgi:hypothetical protein
MPYRTLTNDTPTIDPKLLPAKPTRCTALVSAITPAEARQRRHRQRIAAATETIQMLTTPTPPAALPSTRQPPTVFTPNDGATEQTTAMDRAKATVYRMHPMTIILAILATGLALWLQLGIGIALCIFAATAVAGYAYFNVTDYRYSRAGLERHRISMATQLERERMGHEKDIKAMALDSLIQLHDARRFEYDSIERNVIDVR